MPLMRTLFLWAMITAALPALGADLKLDLGNFHQGQSPTGFLNAVMGKGKPGVTLPRGTTVDMSLDRDLTFKWEELRP